VMSSWTLAIFLIIIVIFHLFIWNKKYLASNIVSLVSANGDKPIALYWSF
jgi:hypothetical protein